MNVVSNYEKPYKPHNSLIILPLYLNAIMILLRTSDFGLPSFIKTKKLQLL